MTMQENPVGNALFALAQQEISIASALGRTLIIGRIKSVSYNATLSKWLAQVEFTFSDETFELAAILPKYPVAAIGVFDRANGLDTSQNPIALTYESDFTLISETPPFSGAADKSSAISAQIANYTGEQCVCFVPSGIMSSETLAIVIAIF